MKRRLALLLISLTLSLLPLQGCSSFRGLQPVKSGLLEVTSFGTFLVDGNHTLWAYGLNTQGYLGLGQEVENTTRPLEVMKNVAKLSVDSASGYALALKTDGSVWEWGRINNTIIYRPQQVFEGAVDIAAGSYGGIAVSTDNKLWGWGSQVYGRTEINGAMNYMVPYHIMNNISLVYASATRFGAISPEGDLYCWGILNGETQVTPRKIAGDVVKVRLGRTSYFLKEDYSLWGFGSNASGQLGNGKSAMDYDTPEEAVVKTPVRIAKGVTDFAYGAESLYFILNGSLWGCGKNNCGQLGNIDGRIDGYDENRVVKTPVLVERNGVRKVYAGASAVYFFKDSALWALGSNNNGQLGVGTPYEELTSVAMPFISQPQQVLDDPISDLALYNDRVACVTGDGSVLLWGSDPLFFFASWKRGEPTPSSKPELFSGDLGKLINIYHITNAPAELQQPDGFSPMSY